MTIFDWDDLDSSTGPEQPNYEFADDEPLATEPNSPEAAAAAQAGEDRTKVELIKVDKRRIKQAEAELRLEDPPEAALRKIRLTKASEFKIKPVRWVWQDRMPLGEITLIPGREGVGKSTFLAWQAAALTRGELPGMWFGTKKAVLYAATEDSWEHTIAPRMLAAGADLDLVYRIDVEVTEGRYAKLVLPTDVDQFRQAALEVGAAALMCDPVISLISDDLNTFKAQELRRALEPLKVAAERAEVGVSALVHFNKGKDIDILTAISGSRGWAEVARAAVAIARDPDAEKYTCVVSQAKNNLGRSDLPSLAYTIVTERLELDDGEVAEVGMVRWTSQTYGRSVQDILDPPKKKSNSPVINAVLDFFTDVWHDTGAGTATGDVVKRLGGKFDPNNIRQAVSRLARTGQLRKLGHGLHAPVLDDPPASRPCPSCGSDLAPDENFCLVCRKQLDTEARYEQQRMDY